LLLVKTKINNKKMNKTFRILELVWLFMGCVGVIMCAFSIISGDNRGSIYFLVFTFACGLMYAVRRKQRMKFDASQKQKEEQKK
jgi:hypothetical protein